MSINILKYSVVINAHNKAEFLLKTLNSVINQTLSPDQYEIIIIDDGSTDDTEAQIINYRLQITRLHQGSGGQAKPEIRYFKIKNGGMAKAMNLGIKESKGEIIFFTNSNFEAPPNWMEIIIDGYRKHPDVAGVGGWYEMAHSSFLDKCLDAMDNKFSACVLNTEIKTNLYFFPDIGVKLANLSYKRPILEEYGGFDENLRSYALTAKELNIKVLTQGHPFLQLPLKVKRIKKFGYKDFFCQYFGGGRDSFYLHRKYPRLIKDAYGGFLNNFLRVFAYADISYFYTAYFFYTLLRVGGRIFAKYWERAAVKEVGISPSETFEISKYPVDEKKHIQISGRLFNKSTFQIIETTGDFYSVVIPTYNRSERLIGSLENLANQTISPECYEIIIIDDGSTDDTSVRVEEFKKIYPYNNINYFHKQNGGPAKARNFGIERARGKFVFFTDDDCTAPNDWIETILAGFKKYPHAMGVGGWIWPPEGELEKSAVSRFLHFKSFSYHPIIGKYIRSHEIISNDPMMCFGNFAYNTANVCYKKEILKEVGGFCKDFYWPGSEDNELAFRITSLGYSLLYLPLHVTHPKAMRLPEFMKIYFRRGANDCLLRTMHMELLEKLKPGSTKDYGSIASFISRLNGPEKFLAFLEWLSLNAGIIYMKNKLERF